MILALTLAAACLATDGDSIRCGPERIRIVGMDTPELHGAKCPQEALKAAEARDRLRELLAGGFQIHRTGKLDRYQRSLARVTVRGRDVASIMTSEGLARPYAGGKRAGWC